MYRYEGLKISLKLDVWGKCIVDFVQIIFKLNKFEIKFKTKIYFHFIPMYNRRWGGIIPKKQARFDSEMFNT